ncbi:MAG: PAS domain S-box protein [Deltaproteobacteria bacterium]|nr:PAS domain S-box protein [Deltaproteobacteria bacterium]
MRLKLSHRFNLHIGGILLIGILAIVYHDVGASTRLLRQIGISEAERLCNLLFDQLHTSMRLGGGRKENRAIVERFGRMRGVQEIRLVHGPVLDRQYGVEEDELPRGEADKNGLAGRVTDSFEKINDGVSSIRHVMPVFIKRECMDCHKAAEGEVVGVISARLSFDGYEAIVGAHTKGFLLWGGGIFVLTSVAVLLTVNYRLLAPLGALKKGADALGAGDLGHSVAIDTGDELEEVGEAFNKMAGALLRTTTRLNDINEKYSRLVQMAVDAIVIKDIETRRFVDVNPAATALTGFSREELLGVSSQSLYPAERAAEYGIAFDRWALDGKGYLRDADIICRDGGRAPVEIAASVIEYGGGKYMLEIWRDISERKGFMQTLNKYVADLEETVAERTAKLNGALCELEEAYKKLKDSEGKLIQSAKLSSLGEMGAGIAHELNSPLAGILSLTEVMMNRAEKGNSNYYFLEKVKDAAVRSKYIIQDMLTYARPAKAGFAPFYMNEIINATLSLFTSELKTSSIEIARELRPDLPRVYGNKGQMMEVFLNIIKNARDAMHGRGTVFVATSPAVDNGLSYAVAEIRDTGSGIPADIMDKIFDPFFSTKQKGGGLNIGLGLSISQSIVKAHGGRIEVRNAPGAGASFKVWMPVYKEDQSRPPPG